MTSLLAADSLLVVDIGTVTTRAVLFDVVDGYYRYLASGNAPTTAEYPFNNVSEGVHRALKHLQQVTGRILLGADESLIIPTAGNGSGVDTFAVTVSAGAPLKIVAVGLLEDVSVESIRNLAGTIYGKVEHVISLNDRRRQDARIDAIMRLRPDLILIAGGTDGGASQSVLNLLDAVGLACYLLPQDKRADILFAGNRALKEELETSLGNITTVHTAPNIRPALDVEYLEAAQLQLSKIYGQIRSRQIAGIGELNTWSGGGLLPTATAFARVIRYLSKTQPIGKGVLGVDIGASATFIAAAFDGDIRLGVFPQFGLGAGVADMLDHMSMADILQWLPVEFSPEAIREYLLQKAMYPASLPATLEELYIEQALARQALIGSLRLMRHRYPKQASSPSAELLPFMEPIVASGSVLTKAPSLGQAAMLLLDGLQPTGITTFSLDQNHIGSALGVASALNPALTVQVLETNSFVHLATVISPVGDARPGTPVLRVKMTYDNGYTSTHEVKQGVLDVLPLAVGQRANLQLQPLHRYDIGMGAPGRGGRVKVTGSALGVIIDARGRPLQLPKDTQRRHELIKKWLWTLGGQ